MEFKKVILIFLVLSLAFAVLSAPAWAENRSVKTDYPDQIYDVLLLRPVAFIGGIGGTGVFIVSLPFVVATGGVKDSFNMFVVKPFWFAFVRKFPARSTDL